MKKTFLCLSLILIILLSACAPYKVRIEFGPESSGSLLPIVTPWLTELPETTLIPESTDAPVLTGPTLDPPADPFGSSELTTPDGFILKLNDSDTYTLMGIVGHTRYRLEIPDEYNGIAITELDKDAFDTHDELLSVTLPGGLTKIPAATFDPCSRLEYNVDGGANYLGMKGNDYRYLISLVEPANAAVLTPHIECRLIADRACESSSVTSLVINKQTVMIRIGEYAFCDCNSLLSVLSWAEEGLGGRMDAHAFEGCDALTDVNLTSWYSIADYAFNECRSLERFCCESTLNSVGVNSFQGCDRLDEVSLPDTVEEIYSDSFPDTYYRYSLFYSGKYLGNEENPYLYLIKDGGASSQGNTTCVKVHKDTKAIARNAFSSAYRLSEITVVDAANSKYLYSIGNCIIERDTSKLIIGIDTSLIPNDGTVVSIAPYAFSYASGMETVVLPPSITEIGEYAFAGCESLMSVTFNEGLITIGDSAFEGCKALEYVSLPASLLNIGNKAFYSCESIGNINLTNVEYIGEYAFAFTNIKIVYTPKSLKKIPQGCFFNCLQLEVAYITSATEIGPLAFIYCSSLSKITLGQELTAIGSEAFGYCKALMNIELPSSLYYLGDGSFAKCESLESLNIPNNITHLKARTFYGCTSLTEVYIHADIVSIESEAFADCTSLQTINYDNYYNNWYNIQIETDWAKGTIEFKVKCLDWSLNYKNGSNISVALP